MAYPTAITSFSNPTGTDYLNSPAHATQHSSVNNDVNAIETKLGIGASACASATDGKVITADGAGNSAWEVIPTQTLNRAFVWYVSGTLVTGTNFGARYVVPQAMTIVKCWLISRTAPTGAAILIDINYDGTTIWSTQGNRATIAAAATAGNTTTFNTTALVAGHYLDLDIDQVGSTIAGIDLTVVLEVSQP